MSGIDGRGAALGALVAAGAAAGLAAGGRRLGGASHEQYLEPRPEPEVDRAEASEEHEDAIERLGELFGPRNRPVGVQELRRRFDGLADLVDLEASIEPVDADGVTGEWVRWPGVPADRRLLYVHGGAFMVGSPRSHRSITQRMSRVAQASVLAIDYRMRPEHSRLDAVDDCRAAYRWILDHGPEGTSGPPAALLLAGDSAGGNLAAGLLAWARDEGIRAVDAAVLFSPATDETMTGPSYRANADTDPMLGPTLGKLARLPRTAINWIGFLMNRQAPSDPRISPLHGRLHDLPPTLVQASLAELLLDDSVRWANKARAAGSPVELQTWPHVVHVWQAFGQDLPEADEAFARVEAFLAEHAPIRP